jgi:hypothetical protein
MYGTCHLQVHRQVQNTDIGRDPTVLNIRINIPAEICPSSICPLETKYLKIGYLHGNAGNKLNSFMRITSYNGALVNY